MKKGLWLLLLVTALTGCSSMNVEDYKMDTPKLVIEDYFNGKTMAWGMFQDPFGNVRNRFKVSMVGHIKDNVLHLDEDFFYQDGSTSKRLWKIKILGNDQYEGTAGDVIGVAKGQSAGNAFNWQYDMDLTISNRQWRVHFDDWLFLQEDGVLINVAKVSKWGVKLGTLTFVFAKEEEIAHAFRK